ncbi:hypothetical protein [Methanobrevibacter sp.]|uniref:hypothetical protein n=1 Tax=Methanobrevibacter sp. TaxID=66852 RepID=UPI00388F064E
MNGKIICIMLIIGMIFSVSSVCAADLNDTQVIRIDDFIQNDINLDIDCNDNSTDNSTEIDFDNIPEGDINLNNTGVLPVEISYDMDPIVIEDCLDKEINYYFIDFNFVKAPYIKDFTLHFDVDGYNDWFVEYDDALNQGGKAFLVASNNENSEYYIPDFNEITVTVSYSINGEMEFHKMTFEKSDFKPLIR